MTKSRHGMALAVLTGLCGGGSASATLIASEPVEIAVRERTVLETRICGQGRKAEEIDAQRIETHPETLWARITCVAHGTIDGYQALKTGECEKTRGRWNCQDAQPALRMKILSEDLVLTYADGVTPAAAVEVVEFVRSVPTFNGQDVSGLLSGRCRIGDGRTAPFPGALSFHFSCAGPTASITKDCWQSHCRFFFTDYAELIP